MPTDSNTQCHITVFSDGSDKINAVTNPDGSPSETRDFHFCTNEDNSKRHDEYKRNAFIDSFSHAMLSTPFRDSRHQIPDFERRILVPH